MKYHQHLIVYFVKMVKIDTGNQMSSANNLLSQNAQSDGNQAPHATFIFSSFIYVEVFTLL